MMIITNRIICFINDVCQKWKLDSYNEVCILKLSSSNTEVPCSNTGIVNYATNGLFNRTGLFVTIKRSNSNKIINNCFGSFC